MRPGAVRREFDRLRYNPEYLALLELARAPLRVGPESFELRPQASMVEDDEPIDDVLPVGWDPSWPRPGESPEARVDWPDRSNPWSRPFDAVRRTQARREADRVVTSVTASGRVVTRHYQHQQAERALKKFAAAIRADRPRPIAQGGADG